jgi:hypothetical protein
MININPLKNSFVTDILMSFDGPITVDNLEKMTGPVIHLTGPVRAGQEVTFRLLGA